MEGTPVHTTLTQRQFTHPDLIHLDLIHLDPIHLYLIFIGIHSDPTHLALHTQTQDTHASYMYRGVNVEILRYFLS